jgi:hypothetical protein
MGFFLEPPISSHLREIFCVHHFSFFLIGKRGLPRKGKTLSKGVARWLGWNWRRSSCYDAWPVFMGFSCIWMKRLHPMGFGTGYFVKQAGGWQRAVSHAQRRFFDILGLVSRNAFVIKFEICYQSYEIFQRGLGLTDIFCPEGCAKGSL